MALRPLYRPLRPDLDDFLFAPVGEERNGIPLSVISALTQLGLDPWDEATRLSSLEKREAVDQLAPMIVRLLGICRSEARDIALDLVALLPTSSSTHEPAEARRSGRWKSASSKAFWLICLLLVAVALVSMAANGELPFGSHRQSAPPSLTEGPGRSG
ncbi:MAG TPA: hypothetical protein VJ770_00295 [Stellaceae bacterium]|nr:hypothetical protein [Stellaceae bacterium]